MYEVFDPAAPDPDRAGVRPAGGGHVCPGQRPAVAEASATDRQLPIYCVQRDQKMLAISFDAAWGNEDTQQLIDILGKYNVKATFFVVGTGWTNTRSPSRPSTMPATR